MLLEIKNVTVRYERIEALKSVSLRLNEGSMIAILGANGAGKSTLIKTISGLKHPIRGEICFFNQRIDRLSPQKIFALGIVQVPENRKLFPRMSVLENLFMGARALKKKSVLKEELEGVYEYFPILKQRLNQQAGTLSGGEQQMLAIGRALMANPKLMLLDEPSLGLAPIMVEELFHILNKINTSGTTTLLAEQNALKALQLVEGAYVLETGMITISGIAEDVAKDKMIIEAYLGG